MIITKATYGGADCTKEIQAKFTNGKLYVVVNNSIIGDPQEGVFKFLEVQGTFEGQPFIISKREGDVLIYPKPKYNKLGVFYSNNNNPDIYNAINVSLNTIKKAAEGKADIVTCVWNQIASNPFHEIISWYKSQSHLNQLLQILQCLYTAKEMGDYEYVSFLEHDVIYPEGYFDYPEINQGEVYTNMNYGGLCHNGWQKRNQNDEPFHQMTMRMDDAIAHLIDILPNALKRNAGMIENQKFIRKHWFCKNEAIHINHGIHFTSHNSIYSKTNVLENHPYWGNYKNFNKVFMNKIKEIIISYSNALNPNDDEKKLAEERLQVCLGCEHWNNSGLVDICNKCGCLTKVKVFSPVNSCPESKWSK